MNLDFLFFTVLKGQSYVLYMYVLNIHTSNVTRVVIAKIK